MGKSRFFSKWRPVFRGEIEEEDEKRKKTRSNAPSD
jgi:hypothetical protein